PITIFGMLQASRRCFEFAGSWHYQEITEVPVPAYTTHLRKSKSFNARMFVAVAGAIVAAGDGVGTKLYHPIRCCSSRKSFTQAVINTSTGSTGAGANKRVYFVSRRLRFRDANQQRYQDDRNNK